MESRWYLFSGQTLENTKISDREHALHMTKTTWDGITKHLDRTKLLQEAADKEAAMKRYLNEGSKNMTKGWENSLENVRKRKEEERLRMIEQKKDDRQTKFLELRKEQEEIRKKYMDKVKKQIFMTTGHARDITSGLIAAEVQFERERQLEFKKKIEDHEKEEDRKYAEAIQRGALQEVIEKAEKKKQQVEKLKMHGGMLKQSIEEKEQFKKLIKEQKIKNEAMENIEAVEEQEKINQLLAHDKLMKKKELLEENKKCLLRQKELEQQKIKEGKELDEVVEIYQKSKHRIDCLRKQREKEMRDAVLVRQEKISAMVAVVQQGREEAENQMIKKAIEERDAAENEKLKEKAEYNEKLKQERLANMSREQQREKEMQKKEIELNKWKLLNRYKADEHMQQYEERKKREMWQQVLKYRQELCEQMEDKRNEQQIDRARDEEAFKTCTEGENEKFFEYANEVMELAKKKGRSVIPIERVIAKYIKQMNIDPHSYGLNSKSNNSCENKMGDLAKKLAKPRAPRKCVCYCPK